MVEQLESDYDCANASADLMEIQQSLEQLQATLETLLQSNRVIQGNFREVEESLKRIT